MYLPKSLQIASPYVSRWYGKSGRQYDFAVVRASSLRLDQPAVYLLARHEGNMVVPLFVGFSEDNATEPAGVAAGVWERALEHGMTHAHLRFEARSEEFRHAEVQDLVVTLQPLLDEVRTDESDSFMRFRSDRSVEGAAAKAILGPDLAVAADADSKGSMAA